MGTTQPRRRPRQVSLDTIVERLRKTSHGPNEVTVVVQGNARTLRAAEQYLRRCGQKYHEIGGGFYVLTLNAADVLSAGGYEITPFPYAGDPGRVLMLAGELAADALATRRRRYREASVSLPASMTEPGV